MGKWRSECRSSEVFVVREEVKRGRGRRANKGEVKCRKGRERVLLFYYLCNILYSIGINRRSMQPIYA